MGNVDNLVKPKYAGLNRGDRTSGVTHHQQWSGEVVRFGVQRAEGKVFAIIKLDKPIMRRGEEITEIAVRTY